MARVVWDSAGGSRVTVLSLQVLAITNTVCIMLEMAHVCDDY